MAVLMLGLIGCAAVLAVTILVVRLLDFRRLEMAIPGPPSLPILGNGVVLARSNENNVFDIAINQFWGWRTELSRFSLFNKLAVFVSDPDDLSALFRRKEFDDKAVFFYCFFDRYFPKGLISVNGSEWRSHRKVAQHAFHAEILNSYEDVFAEEAENFSKRIEPSKEQCLHDNLYKALSRAFIHTAMSSDVRPDTEQALVDVLDFVDVFTQSLNEYSRKPWKQWYFDYTSEGRDLLAKSAKVRSYCHNIMVDRRKKLDAKDTTDDSEFLKRKKTLLDVLLDSQTNAKVQLKDSDVDDEIFQFLGAAVETSASTLSSVMKVLSIYPDIQEKVYAEVQQVLGDSKRSVTLDDLRKLEVMERVIKETLRILPAVPFVARQVHERTEFAGKVLPAGTTMIANIYGVHRDPRHWTDPTTFNPDRFLNEEGRHPYAYIPFSTGPRNCIGSRYSMNIMKTILATTLRDYRIDPANDGVTHHDQLHITFSLTLSIVGGARVTFTPRSQPL